MAEFIKHVGNYADNLLILPTPWETFATADQEIQK
jgi:hypothetical protein